MKSISQYIKECNKGIVEPGIYTSEDEDKRKIVVLIDKDMGAEVRTLQNNGWWQIVYYDKFGFVEGTTYLKEAA
jgi:hypothetical protein